MPLTTCVLFTLSLLLCGAYAGITVMCQIGVLPAMRRLSLPAYADAWRAMDSYLDRSMPPFKITLLLLTLATTVCLWAQHHTQLAEATALSFALTLTGLVLTIVKQLPLNARLKTLPTDESVLLAIREQTVTNFAVRLIAALAAFVSLGVGIVLWPIR